MNSTSVEEHSCHGGPQRDKLKEYPDLTTLSPLISKWDPHWLNPVESHSRSPYCPTSIPATIMVTTKQEYSIVGSGSGEAKGIEPTKIQTHNCDSSVNQPWIGDTPLIEKRRLTSLSSYSASYHNKPTQHKR